MKKMLIIMILISMMFLTGCDLLSSNTINTDDNFTYVTPTDYTTTLETTFEETTLEETTEATTEYVPTIIAKINEGQDTVELNSEWVDQGAILCVDDEVFEMTTESTVNTDMLGLYVVIYTINYEQKDYLVTRYVIVVDQTAPFVALKPGIDTITIGEEWFDAGIIYYDNTNSTITVTVMGTVNNQIAGVYEITYIVKDFVGNSTTLTRYVHVYEA
ncbi:immunoglobulin-like domain-containing protein [Candidatus Izemoplasma sp. B36]|uniref:immunoglobulin-like domain-containing protein n=1 Tax=Candidatus Izemoplasma sp. B36 TaxID=3242468 RepID=UPI003557D6B7